MKAIVMYASGYGFTRGIAEFIAEKLRQQGTQAEVRQINKVIILVTIDVFVIGSAVYMEHWLKEATKFIMQNRSILASRHVWLFSSGPLNTEVNDRDKDSQDLDLRVISEPKEIAQFREVIKPRDHRVFFGGLDSNKLAFKHRMIRKMPASRTMLPEGDFRDWNDIEAWAVSIARALEAQRKAKESETKFG